MHHKLPVSQQLSLFTVILFRKAEFLVCVDSTLEVTIVSTAVSVNHFTMVFNFWSTKLTVITT